MKAVVLELKNGQAAVLDREGIVRVIPDHGYAVGEVLEVRGSLLVHEKEQIKFQSTASARRRMRRHSLLAAACLSLAVFAGGISAVAMPVATVTVDSEPSVGYSLNIFGSVINVTPYNDKAREVSDELSRHVRGQKIGKAVQITLDVFSEKGYLTQDGLSAAVSVDAPASQQTAVEDQVNEGLNLWKESRLTQEEAERFVTETVVVYPELKEEARQEGITPGRIVMDRYEPEPHPGPDGGMEIHGAGTGNMPEPGEDSLQDDQNEPEAGAARPDGLQAPPQFSEGGMEAQSLPAVEPQGSVPVGGENPPQGHSSQTEPAEEAGFAEGYAPQGVFGSEAPQNPPQMQAGPGEMNPYN